VEEAGPARSNRPRNPCVATQRAPPGRRLKRGGRECTWPPFGEGGANQSAHEVALLGRALSAAGPSEAVRREHRNGDRQDGHHGLVLGDLTGWGRGEGEGGGCVGDRRGRGSGAARRRRGSEGGEGSLSLGEGQAALPMAPSSRRSPRKEGDPLSACFPIPKRMGDNM